MQGCQRHQYTKFCLGLKRRNIFKLLQLGRIAIDGEEHLCQLLGNPHPHRPSAPAFLSRQHCTESVLRKQIEEENNAGFHLAMAFSTLPALRLSWGAL